MGIGAFGIDPASKFATEKRKTPKQKLTLLYLRIPLLGSGQLSGRVARNSISRRQPAVPPAEAADPDAQTGTGRVAADPVAWLLP